MRSIETHFLSYKPKKGITKSYSVDNKELLDPSLIFK